MHVEISDPRFDFDQTSYTRFLTEQGFTADQIDSLTILVGPFTGKECREMSIPTPPVQSYPFGSLRFCSLIINTCSPSVLAESISYELLELTHEYRQYINFLKHMAGEDPHAIAKAWIYCLDPDDAYEFADYYLNTCQFFRLKQPVTTV